MLERFGFTPTESKTYRALLKLGPSTGYGVAQELGIARANIYQSLESLVRRRAARKAATIPSQYSAVTPAALVAELERDFRRDLESLDESLRSLAVADDRADAAPIEVLVEPARLIARAGEVVDHAVTEVLAVTGPWASDLDAALTRAAARRVSVRCVALGEPAPAGAVVRSVSESQLMAYWGGLPVAVAADRVRAVFGVLTARGASGVTTDAAGVVPFVRHLLRR